MTADIGHNSINQDLKAIVDRIERLEGEKSDLTADIKAVYDESKRKGFDTKIIRAVVKDRRMDQSKLEELEALKETYRRALGQFIDTPLGQSAVDAAAG